MLTQERLQEVYEYNPDTGLFTHKRHGRRGRAPKNAVAGYIMKTGYVGMCIDRRKYLAHRLAWLYVYGAFPDGEIDHVNLNRADNRLVNIRVCNRAQNEHNTLAHKDNMCGVKGVTYRKARNKYVAQICIEGKNTYIGIYDTLDDAANAYAESARKLRGEFARVK